MPSKIPLGGSSHIEEGPKFKADCIRPVTIRRFDLKTILILLGKFPSIELLAISIADINSFTVVGIYAGDRSHATFESVSKYLMQFNR